MHKYLQFYYQNRLKLWAITLAIVFGIVIIQVLNGLAKEEENNQEAQNQNEGTTRKCCSLC